MIVVCIVKCHPFEIHVLENKLVWHVLLQCPHELDLLHKFEAHNLELMKIIV
jgi:hypothetical protein